MNLLRLLALAICLSGLGFAQYPLRNATSSDLLRSADHAVSTLAVSINSTDLTVTLNTPSNFVAFSVITIDAELLKVCAYDGNVTITICAGGRGQSNGNTNTTAASHTGGAPNVGAVVWNAVNAIHHNVLADELINFEAHPPHAFGAAFTPTTGTTLTVGQFLQFKFPYPCIIRGWGASVHGGTITFDLRRKANGAGSPTSSDSLTASAPPAITTGDEASGNASSVSTWTTSIAANDNLTIVITAVSGATDGSLVITCQ